MVIPSIYPIPYAIVDLNGSFVRGSGFRVWLEPGDETLSNSRELSDYFGLKIVFTWMIRSVAEYDVVKRTAELFNRLGRRFNLGFLEEALEEVSSASGN